MPLNWNDTNEPTVLVILRGQYRLIQNKQGIVSRMRSFGIPPALEWCRSRMKRRCISFPPACHEGVSRLLDRNPAPRGRWHGGGMFTAFRCQGCIHEVYVVLESNLSAAD